jgi:hypothetical protein
VIAFFGVSARPWRPVLLLLTWFLLFWGVFLFFYAGSYDYGADVRYSLVSYAPLALLAGRGATWLHAAGRRMGLGGHVVWVTLGAVAIVQLLWFLPQVRAVGDESWEARADVAFAHRVIRELPPNSLVLTHNPSVFLIEGVDAAQMWMATEDAGFVLPDLAARHAGGVYLHWNAWCTFGEAHDRQLCEGALHLFDRELFREYRERDYRYAFYRLKTETAVLRKIQ